MPLTYDEAEKIARQALEDYKKAQTREEVEKLMIKYGRDGIGWKPLCRILFSRMPLERALKGYIKEEAFIE